MSRMDPISYLEGLEASLSTINPHTSALIRASKGYCEKKFWHECSLNLIEAMEDDAVKAVAFDLHEHVITPIRVDIAPENYVKLVFTTVFCARDEDATRALELVDSGCAALISRSEQAYQSLRCIRATILMKNEATLEARRTLDSVSDFLSSTQAHELEPVLRATLSKAQLRESELLRDFTRYYKIVFDCVDHGAAAALPMSEAEIAKLGYMAAIAALLSPTIHNFGQLLSYRPFSSALLHSDDTWILNLIKICNDGDVPAFNEFLELYATQLQNIPDVAAAIPLLKKKIRLMALLHLVFYTPADQRRFSFEMLAARCSLAKQDVELLLLSALALKLIDGKLDGLFEVIEITWVQPRVLSTSEIRELAGRIGTWRKKVGEAADNIDTLAKDIPQ